MSRARSALVALTLLLAVLELVDAFSLENPASGVVYAVAVGVLGVLMTRTARRWPVVVNGLLALLELVAVLVVYPNQPDPPSWLHLAPFALVTAAVVGLSLVVLRERAAVPADRDRG